ncbi:hypothetical protein Salat_2079800 [Sesamum alatum]|uniref:Uncharacterized protein n=1 Tax=Sesamum alatum TaxID=300844 RepID=A0AAE2CGH0_9LAMI|nr:hypothetical protein Salat_2079800 [Sesamum alatum]
MDPPQCLFIGVVIVAYFLQDIGSYVTSNMELSMFKRWIGGRLMGVIGQCKRARSPGRLNMAKTSRISSARPGFRARAQQQSSAENRSRHPCISPDPRVIQNPLNL